MADPVRIQIGSFGHLYHDTLNYKLIDTFLEGESVSERIIDLPNNDFFLVSVNNVIYFWEENKEKGTWYSSERIRREREAAEQAEEISSNLCNYEDHPEGCLDRAIQAGFGCILYTDEE